jgi:hypothetical protein
MTASIDQLTGSYFVALQYALRSSHWEDMARQTKVSEGKTQSGKTVLGATKGYILVMLTALSRANRLIQGYMKMSSSNVTTRFLILGKECSTARAEIQGGMQLVHIHLKCMGLSMEGGNSRVGVAVDGRLLRVGVFGVCEEAKTSARQPRTLHAELTAPQIDFV